MLRDNALRLRRYCSATARAAPVWGLTPGWRPIARMPSALIKAYLSTISNHALPEKAIGYEEWLAALAELWPRGQRAPKKIGLAISGGVDSMALAKLWMLTLKMRKAKGLPESAHAFIIDHKARSESEKEAKWVATQLRNHLKIPSTIIPLPWPEGFDIANPASFESDARRLRYQALGKACMQHDITDLLVAHHADDQAETVLMRLMDRRWRTGLAGMKSVEWIPECEGIHGVHHSSASSASRFSGQMSQFSEHQQQPIPFPVETGGVRILRPLLKFPKSRLIKTCEKYSFDWAEDKTNQDATLTQRNAVRRLFKDYQLPEALSRDSLIHLSEHVHVRMEEYKEEAELLFCNKCLIKLDLQTGSLIARLPTIEDLLPRKDTASSEDLKAHARSVAYYLLRRIGQLVSPQSTPSRPANLAAAVLRIWPSLASKAKAPSESSFSCFSISWRKSDFASPFDLSSETAHPREWLLTRQSRNWDLESRPICIPPTFTEPWHLFDGRFWIRVHNASGRNIFLRHLTRAELNQLLRTKMVPDQPGYHRELYPGQHQILRSALRSIKLQAQRENLPALFIAAGDGEGSSAKPILVALPTLGADIAGMDGAGLMLRWTVRYKKIDVGTRKLRKRVVGPLQYTHDDEATRATVRTMRAFERRPVQPRPASVAVSEDALGALPKFENIEMDAAKAERSLEQQRGDALALSIHEAEFESSSSERLLEEPGFLGRMASRKRAQLANMLQRKQERLERLERPRSLGRNWRSRRWRGD